MRALNQSDDYGIAIPICSSPIRLPSSISKNQTLVFFIFLPIQPDRGVLMKDAQRWQRIFFQSPSLFKYLLKSRRTLREVLEWKHFLILVQPLALGMVIYFLCLNVYVHRIDDVFRRRLNIFQFQLKQRSTPLYIYINRKSSVYNNFTEKV